MKIIVTGAAGQLGTDVMLRLKELGVQAVGAAHTCLDITDYEKVKALFDKEKPDAVIHCAAFTMVDKAEIEREACRACNVSGSESIARAAASHNAKCLYVSTDYVFGGDGDEPYETDSPKHPVNYYGQTKLEGEEIVRSLCEKHFIVRTSWVFGGHGHNFVKSMLWLGKKKDEIGVVNDQIGSPTYTPDLARLLCDMVFTEKYGVYHATNEGFCSWAQFAAEIMRQSETPCTVRPITSAEYPSAAKRPLNSRLSKSSLDKAGFERLPLWQDALARYLSNCRDED